MESTRPSDTARKSQQGYRNPSPRQFANDLLAVKSFERGEAWANHRPIEVYLQVASACNLDCYMCYEHLRPVGQRRGKGLKSMPPELFAKLERDVLPYATKVTFGVGGEPMLCEHLLDYIERSFALRLHVHLMTNGTRITSDPVARTLARCLTSMEISIDAATPETYERIRLGSRFAHLVANIERLNRFRMQDEPAERTHLALVFVLMKSNVHELPQFVELAHRLKADRVGAWHVIPVTEEGRREALIDDQQRCDHFLALARARAQELGIEADFVKPFDARTLEPKVALAGTRQEAIERMARLDSGEQPAEVLARAPLGGPGGSPAAATLPRAPLPEPEIDAGAPLRSEPLDLASWVPAGWQPGEDPPDPEAAAIALADYLARPKGKRLHCASPYTSAFIFYDGRVFPCCHPHAHTKLPMGNLLVQEFAEIWNGRAYRNLRAGLAQGDPPPLCQRCSIVHGPSQTMESARADEGEGADLGTYYGALDLEPRARHEREHDLVSGLQQTGLSEELRRAMASLREHEHLRAELVEQLRGLYEHAGTLSRELDGLRAHRLTIESELGTLKAHARTLERETGAQRGHIATLEAERTALLGHVANLERILDRIKGRQIYRVLCRIKDSALFWRPRSPRLPAGGDRA